MIRSYRCYQNMGKDRAEKQVSIELLQFPSVLCWLVFELHEAVAECCHLFHHIPVPKWLADLEHHWDGETESKFSDYYGDDWDSIWHCCVEMPLQDYLNHRFGKIKRQFVFIEAPLSYWDRNADDLDVNWIRANIEREKRYGVNENGYSLAPYRCDYPGETWLYKLLEWATAAVADAFLR